MKRYLRNEAGHQGELHWNQKDSYDDEMARQLIVKDRAKTILSKKWVYTDPREQKQA